MSGFHFAGCLVRSGTATSGFAFLVVAALSSCSDTTGPTGPVPGVYRVSPNNGPRSGGQKVTLTGSGLDARIDSVVIGSARLLNVTHVYHFEITGTTPPRSEAGRLSVRIYTSGGMASCEGCYSYNPPVVWDKVSAGAGHSCALAEGGAAYCWGDNLFNQLGQGEGLGTTERCDDWALFQCSMTPLAVAGGFLFSNVTTAGDRNCGLTESGTGYCWGGGEYGSYTGTPVAKTNGVVFESLASSYGHICGLIATGAAYCWGSNHFGQLGDGSRINRDTPVPVEGGLIFSSIVVSSHSSCALTTAGAAYCWGAQGDGGLRSSDPPVIREFPVVVPGGLTFASLAAGEYHVCGLTSSGSVYCWGFNAYGQIGDGTTIDRETVTAVSGGLTFATLTAGYYRTCGLTTAGAAYCWGYDGLNHPAGTYAVATPLAVGGPNFTALAIGFDHTCGLTAGGTIFCWGSNDSGQLGDGTTVNKTSPVAVKNP